MSWFSENKFLLGIVGVTVVGAGVLGWLTLGASAKYSDAQTAYQSAVSELTNLQTQKPFPSQANLKLVEAQKAEALESVQALQRQLAGGGFTMSDLSASGFQLELKKTIDALSTRASQSGLNLTGSTEPGAASRKFDLGFEYLSQNPDETAAKPLSRQLKSIEWVVNQLIEGGASQLLGIKRSKVAEEEPVKAAPKPSGPGARGNQKQTQAEPPKLFATDKFEVKFMADPRKAIQILNNIVGSKEQFYIVRKITVKNEKENPPSKADANNSASAVPAGAAADGSGKPAGPKMTYVLGEEQIVVTLDLEALYFPEPTAPATSTKPAAASSKPATSGAN